MQLKSFLLTVLITAILGFSCLVAVTSAFALPVQVCGEGIHTFNPHCVTPTPTLQPTATPTPEDEVTPTPEITETPTATPEAAVNLGGPGDGRSDGRSDGLCSKPPCHNGGMVVPAQAPAAGRGAE